MGNGVKLISFIIYIPIKTKYLLTMLWIAGVSAIAI